MGAISFRTATRTVPLGEQARLRKHPPAFGLERWQVDGRFGDDAAKVLVLQLLGARQALGDLDHVVLDWQDAVIETGQAAAVCTVAREAGARCVHVTADLPAFQPDPALPLA